MPKKILAINPGSTSTKVAVFNDSVEIVSQTIRHSAEDLTGFEHITDQYEFRKTVIENWLKENDIPLGGLDAIVGRGGLLRPIPGGTYPVSEKMMKELKKCERGEHASNLGGMIAWSMGEKLHIPAFIVDPVVVDEMHELARISGTPLFERISIFHALNQKAVARKAAAELGRDYTELNLVVVHLGGGISVGSHLKGRVIDVNNALNGDGPFSPERAGGVPAGQLIDLCYSGKYSQSELKKMLVGKGGIVAYLGTNDMVQVENKAAEGSEKESLLQTAMTYQIAKEIGLAAVVLKGKVDAIVITGGIAYNRVMMDSLKDYTGWIAPIFVYPGEKELEALAEGALRVLTGVEKPGIY